MKENTIAKKSYYCISFLFLLAIWLVGTPVKAQNVVVSPSTGKLIAAYTDDTEEGFQHGCSALWRHNQLPLTITVADDGKLTAGKELANPANNLVVIDDKMVLLGGKYKDSYMLVSLPRGYRFTGYSITLQNNLNGVTAFGAKWGAINKWFYETNSNFDLSNPLGTAKDTKGNTTMSGSNSQDKSGEFTLSRQGTDMGNRLYFILHRGQDALFGVTIKSFELHFSIDKFTVALNVNPISENEKKSLVEAPFKINKPELGEIKPHSLKGNTYYSYNYENVADMIAYNSLYQKDAVKDGKAADVAPTRTISCLVNGGKKWFGLGNNTYYVESPTTIKNANGTDMPVGYRITGAKLTCSWGTNSPTAGYVITYNNGDEFYYLGIGENNDLKFTTSPSVWQMDDDHLHQGNQYICKNNNNGLYTGSSSNYAATFKIEDGKLTDKTYYLTYTTNGDAELTTDPSKAVNIFSNDAYNVPTSDYTVKLYGTDPNTSNPLTETISATNASKVMEITGLNNDAVKFTVEGLKGNSQALVSVELTMEALNPYIHSLDIVSHDDSNGSSKTITQTFTASNFMVRGEHFTFHVPKNQTGAWWFSFENLKSDYADDTYYDQKGTGNSRYCFVTSKYYTENPDLYNAATPNAPYTDKVKSETAGTKPFRFSNIDELVNTNTSQDTKYLEEYPFSLKAYQDAGGNFGTFTLDDKTDQKDNIAYLFTCDETRYNIAPTTATQHRYYAYYLMDIEIEKKEYQPKFSFKKVYDSSLATTANGDDTSSQWGVEVTTTEQDGTDYGYLSLKTIMEGLSTALHDETTTDHPTTMRQLLYMDLSKLNEVIVSENAGVSPYAETLASLSPNAVIYLPYGTTVTNTDNCAAATTKEGAFYATGNIILTDKSPLYIPYQINVPAEHYAKYTRNITVSKYGKARNATIMLPFTLSIDENGEHTNSGKDGDQLSFTVNTLQNENCISSQQTETGEEINEGKGWYVHFIPYTSSTEHTEANTPYMVHVTKAPSDEDVSFTALEYGSNIMATTQVGTDGKITGDPCTGIYDNKNVTLTPVATYCGTQLDKNQDKCFYWGNNFFNSSWTLSANYDKVNIRPFRSWFSCEGFSTAKAATLYAFFGENTATATGISNVEQKTDGLTIEGTAGALLIRSPYSQTLDIRNTQGILVKRVTLRAGEQSETYLPAGIYIAAGKKVMVK